jgi:hypothetical protein
MDHKVSEREVRQYRLMRDRLDALRAGSIAIDRAIADLKGLGSALEEASEDWRDRYVEARNGLELAYAVALDRNEPLPTAATDPAVRAALDLLDALLDERSSE